MGENPIISVIVPVFNVDKYLDQCIGSILNQTFTDFELILVNDGSFDYSYKICKEYAAKDSRVRVLSQENKGLSAARNLGIENAKGQYLSFVDSDDYVIPEYLDCLYTILIENDAEVVIGEFYRYNEETNMLYYHITDDDLSHSKLDRDESINNLLTMNNFTAAWGKLYKKSIFDSLRFPEGRYYEDNHVLIKIYLKSKSTYYIKRSLYCYRITANSITSSKQSFHKIQDYVEAMEEILLDMTLSGYFKGSLKNVFLTQYRDRLIRVKNELFEKNLIENNLYYKIIQRLQFLDEFNQGDLKHN